MNEIFKRCAIKTPVFEKYVQVRGFAVPDVAPFDLGFYRYKPTDWDNYKLVKAFDQSIFLPVYDDAFNPAGFELRTTGAMKQHFKYYDPKARYYFFGFTKQGLQEIFDSETVFLTEGTFKTISLSFWKKNVLGLMTSKVSDSQKIFLKRFVKTIFLCFDFDKTGLSSQKKVQEELSKEGFNVQIFQHVLGSDTKGEKQIKDADALMELLGKEKFVRTMNQRFRELGYGST